VAEGEQGIEKKENRSASKDWRKWLSDENGKAASTALSTRLLP